MELVAFQLGELTKANVQAGEDEDLATLRQVLRQADTIQRLCAMSYAELYESEGSVLANLGHVWKRVGELAAIEPRFATHLDQRDGIKAQLEDLAFALRDYSDNIDASPGRLEQVEQRLALLEQLKRKHGPTLDEVIARREALTAEHRSLTGDGTSPADLESALAAASASYVEAARTLSAARRSAARKFATALERELADLAMDRTRFEVRFEAREDPANWSERGIDVGEFYLSPNPGEDLRPLARIVSGGELSRIMLALKTLAAGDAVSKTLIFDEVDAGIGGRVATVVGEKLRALGTRFQVLCISHLPQIAAAASTHFHIEKSIRGSRTVTTVARLADTDRVEELARMLAGAAVGDRIEGDRARAPAPGHGESAARPPDTWAKGERRKAKTPRKHGITE